MPRGKNIQLFLIDGDASGRIKCTLANWTGVAYKLSRNDLKKCKDREDLAQSGVYFLFGTSDKTEDNVVYVGQAGIRKNGEGILGRLQEHKKDDRKDYWTEAVVFTTSNNSFGPTEISYLEHRFTSIAQTAKRYTIKNANEPVSGGTPTEEKESELEEFIDHARLIMGVLGHKVFEPYIKSKCTADDDILADNNENLLFLSRTIKKTGITVKATCMRTPEGFVVRKGAKINLDDFDYIPHGAKVRREIAKKDKIDENGILLEDMLFNSATYASCFVIGANSNGQTRWKNAEGKSLREIELEE